MGLLCRDLPPCHDALSIGLRHISQLSSLRHLKLTGCHVVGKQMFEDRTPVATWPSLTSLQLQMSITTPDGRRYFNGDSWSAKIGPGYAEDDLSTSLPLNESAATFDSADLDMSDFAPEHAWLRESGMIPYCSFRLKSDSAMFDPFMTSVVRAVARMPMLRHIEICMSDSSRPGRCRPQLLRPRTAREGGYT